VFYLSAAFAKRHFTLCFCLSESQEINIHLWGKVMTTLPNKTHSGHRKDTENESNQGTPDKISGERNAVVLFLVRVEAAK